MKKAIGLITVLVMLVASSAFASVTAEFPAFWNSTAGWKSSFNGTQMYLTGFGLNGTAKADKEAIGLQSMNSSMTDFHIYASDVAGGCFNGTVNFANSTGIYEKATFGATNVLALNQNLGNVNGLVTVAVNTAVDTPYNATQYYVPVGGYQAMFGLTNSSVNASLPNNDLSYLRGHGLSMMAMYANGSFDGIESSSDVWDYYAYGRNILNGKPIYIIGQVMITADTGSDKAYAKYYMYNGTKTDNVTAGWITYNATGIESRNSLALTCEGGLTLLQNSTINADKNMIIGRVGAGAGISALDRSPLFVVMVKNGVNLTAEDLRGHAYRQVYVGSGEPAPILGNATGGILQYSIDAQDVLDGNGTVFQAANYKYNKTDMSLSGYNVDLADTAQFVLSQSNMTLSNAAETAIMGFYGRMNAERTFAVGIMEGIDEGSFGISFLVPAAASTGPIVAAGSAYQGNASLALHGLALNSTGYSKTALRTQWTGIPENFTPLTEVKGFNATYTETQAGDVYYTFQFAFDGVGDKVENLHLYKLFPTSARSVADLSYASSAAKTSDGAWWISTDTGDGYIGSNSILSPARTYYLNYVIKDNGSYDYKTTIKQIGDPVVLGSVPASSSSSSGCVFNPAAGFGLEWLLLMLAPMVAVVRSRFKK